MGEIKEKKRSKALDGLWRGYQSDGEIEPWDGMGVISR